MSWISTAAALASLAASAPTSLVGSDVVLTTRDGRQHRGHVLTETATGYLLRTDSLTEVVEFASILDINGGEAPPTPVPTPAAVVADPSDWLAQRRGFRIGVGVGGFVYPWITSFHENPSGAVYSGALTVPCSFDFGRTGIRLTPMLGATAVHLDRVATTAGMLIALDAQLRVHATRRFSFGIGLLQAAQGNGSVNYGIGPSLTPFSVQFGSELQHEVAGWVAVPFVPADSMVAASPLAWLGYAYFW